MLYFPQNVFCMLSKTNKPTTKQQWTTSGLKFLRRKSLDLVTFPYIKPQEAYSVPLKCCYCGARFCSESMTWPNATPPTRGTKGGEPGHSSNVDMNGYCITGNQTLMPLMQRNLPGQLILVGAKTNKSQVEDRPVTKKKEESGKK